MTLEGLLCHIVYPFIHQFDWQLFIAMFGLVQGLWFLVHHPHWILTGTLLGILCLGDLAGIVLQDQCLLKLG